MVDCHPNSRYAHNLCTQCERLLSIMVTILFLSPTSDDILVSGNYEKANETHITDMELRLLRGLLCLPSLTLQPQLNEIEELDT